MANTLYGNTPSASGLSGNGEGALNKASAGAHAAVDEAARKAKPAIDQVSSMAHKAVDSAASAVAPTADWLAEKGESLNAAQKKLMDDTCSYISAHPLKSIGMAVVAGYLISRFTR